MPATLQNVQRLRTVGILVMLAGIAGDSLLHWPYAVTIPILVVALVCILLALRIERRAKLVSEVIPVDQRHKRFAILFFTLIVAAVGGYFLMRHTNPEDSATHTISISLFSFLLCASIFAWKIYYPRTPIRVFLKTRAGQVTFALFSIAGGIFAVYSFAHLVRVTHTRSLDQDLGTAWTESQKLPPGYARGEDFLRRLKAINTDHAPPELKQALSDYIAACERGLIASEAGRGTTEQDKAMAEAQKRIVAIEQKYK